MSAGLSLLAVGLGTLLPLSAAAIPLWLLYGVTTGTIAMGCWVIAHECGHHAFHPNRRIEGVVGFVLHSILLVPYYSWPTATRCTTPTAITWNREKPMFRRGQRHRWGEPPNSSSRS